MGQNLLFFFVTITMAATITTATINKCGSQLLRSCWCGETFIDKTSHFVVNCTNLNFNTTEPLQTLPEQTTWLIFTGNRLDVLPANLFNDRDLSELKVVDLSNNHIRDIKGKSFHHVANVERLILNHNSLSISSDDDVMEAHHHPRVFSNLVNLQELHLTNAFADNTSAALADDLHDIFRFSNLTKLYKLHLEQNEISAFNDENVFCPLTDLHDLYLGDNSISAINFNVNCLKKLRYLDLEHNNLTKLNSLDLEFLDRMAPPYRPETLLLEIGGNPFKCEQALYAWLHTTKIQVRNVERLQCHLGRFGVKLLMSLGAAKVGRLGRALTVLLAVLGVVLVALIGGFVFLKRGGRCGVGKVFEGVMRKVHYTTIEEQNDV